jgi:hypothetical protein
MLPFGIREMHCPGQPSLGEPHFDSGLASHMYAPTQSFDPLHLNSVLSQVVPGFAPLTAIHWRLLWWIVLLDYSN